MRTYKIDFNIELKEQSLLEEAEYAPVKIPGFEFYDESGKTICPGCSALTLVRKDDDGNVQVFDSEGDEAERFSVPVRFDPYHEGAVLPMNATRGDLIFPAKLICGKQNYTIYFDDNSKPDSEYAYHGLIGDGDCFIQSKGKFQAPANIAPFEYGDRVFGKKGLWASSLATKRSYFFEDISNTPEEHDFILNSELKDCEGNSIFGALTFYDYTENGALDLIAGKPDGSIWIHENLGDNQRPVYSSGSPLQYEDGIQLSVIPYVKDETVPVFREDGSINPDYPKVKILRVHGAGMQLNIMPRWIKLDYDVEGLLVGIRGLVLFFEKTKRGFKEGVWLVDQKGEKLFVGKGIDVINFDNSAVPGLIGGGHAFAIRFFKNNGFINNSPSFEEVYSWKKDPVDPQLNPLVLPDQKSIFLGSFFGTLMKTEFDYREGVPKLITNEYVSMRNASLGYNMGPLEYTDINNDGSKDLLMGDITGGIYFARNQGTMRKPYFTKTVQLEDEAGPIKIIGGPDPNLTQDGYSKPTAVELCGSGRKDIVVGTGLGKIYFYENTGINQDGIPVFKAGKVMKDTAGNDIGCHHMSGVAFNDTDGNGVPDMIVGGSGPIHAYPDDDPDSDSWVRYYRGIRKDGVVYFEPYKPLLYGEDMFFTYRPRPAFHFYEGKKVLLLNDLMYSFESDKENEVEFAGSFPYPLVKDCEGFSPSDIRFSKLSLSDSIVIYGSCYSIARVFRESFIANNGYMDIDYVIDKKTMSTRSNKKIELVCSDRFDVPLLQSNSNHDNQDMYNHSNEFYTAGLGGLGCMDLVEPDCAINLLLAHTERELCFKVDCKEPFSERFIALGKYNESFLNLMDDGLMVKLLLQADSNQEYVWFITSSGHITGYVLRRREQNLQKMTGIYPEFSSRIQEGICEYNLRIPKEKLQISDKCFCHVARYRNLYVDMPKGDRQPAHEQKYKEILVWKKGWVELNLGN